MTAFDITALQQLMATDGVCHIPGFLTAAQLADVEAAFDWTIANPGPGATNYPGDVQTRQDLANPLAYAAYDGMLRRSPIPALLQQLWGGGPVWFMYEQIFLKENGAGITPWHQDTSYQPVAGQHLAVVWISLDPVNREQTLEYCAGSYKGPLYNASTFKLGDLTDPLYKTGDMPRLPDVEATRADRDIKGWASEPGDIVLFHPSTLHGGGSPGKSARRRTVTLRFFGEDATYSARLGPTAAPRVEGLHELLKDGDAFRHSVFPRLA